jgi:hypothetical protein
MNNNNHAYDYKSILFLNNCAVTMMERGCYEQAYATLKNAADVSKILLSDPEQASELIRGKLTTSLERLSNPMASSSLPGNTHTTLPLNVIAHNQATPRTPTNYLIVRINDTEHDDLLDENDHVVPRLLMAIVFFNVASCSLYIQDERSCAHADKYMALAFRLASNCCSNDNFVKLRSVHIAALVLQTLPPTGKYADILARVHNVTVGPPEEPLFSPNSAGSAAA